MKNAFKNTAAATIAVVTLAAAGTVTTIDTAEAGRKDFWAGAGAGLITGVIINEAARNRNNNRHYRPRHVAPRQSAWDAHVDWCYANYASYSHRSDTFIARGGREKRCNSPYL